MLRIPIYLLLLFVSLNSCTRVDLAEQNTSIYGNAWDTKQVVTGKISITDTSALYNIYLVLRHTDAYRYNNIWLNIGLQSPGSPMQFKKTEIVLGSDAQGWEGTGMNDIWEIRKKLNGVPEPISRAGVYNYSIAHIMRDDPLPNVLSVGLRIEKAGE